VAPFLFFNLLATLPMSLPAADDIASRRVARVGKPQTG